MSRADRRDRPGNRRGSPPPRCARLRRSPRSAAPRSRGSGGRNRARAADHDPRRPGTARRRSCRGNRSPRGRRSRPGAPRSRAWRSGRAVARAPRRSRTPRRAARDARPRAPLYSPSLACGRTPISIENSKGLPASGSSPRSSSGSPIGLIPDSSIASAYQAAERAPQRLVEHRLAPQPTDHDGRRHLALAEAGHPHLPAELARGLLEAPFDLLRGHLGLRRARAIREVR